MYNTNKYSFLLIPFLIIFWQDICAQNDSTDYLSNYLLGDITVKIKNYNDKDNILSLYEVYSDLDKNKKILLEKKNNIVLGFYLPLSIYNFADKKAYETSEKWFDKSSWYYKTFISIFGLRGEKQVKKIYTKSNEIFMKIGEKPIFYTPHMAQLMTRRLINYYKINGFLDVEVEYKIKQNKTKVDLQYTIDLKTQYKINNIDIDISDSILKANDHLIDFDLVKKGDGYAEKNILSLVEHITKQYRNNGFFHFYKNYIKVELDTLSLSSKKLLNLKLLIQSKKNKTNKYKIKSVEIYPDYTYYLDTLNLKIYNKIQFLGNENSINKYDLEHISTIIPSRADSVYKQDLEFLTYQNLNRLNLFKKIDIDYQEITEKMNSDSTKDLRLTVYLLPKDKYSLNFNLDVSFSNSFWGSNAKSSFGVNNFLGMNDINNFDFSYSLRNYSNVDYKITANEFNLGWNIRIPKLLFWSSRDFTEPLHFTNIDINFNRTYQIGISQNIFNFSFEYERNYSSDFKVNYSPLSLSLIKLVDKQVSFENALDIYYPSLRDSLYIKNENSTNYSLNQTKLKNWGSEVVTDDLQSIRAEVLADHERLDIFLQENFIFSSNISFTSGQNNSSKDYFYKAFFESSGFALSLFDDFIKEEIAQNSNQARKTFLDVPYAQYIKGDFDNRYYLDLGDHVLAFRSLIGVTYPYGNSYNIPFHKRYYAGGASDMRAWVAYTLGPGSSKNIYQNSIKLTTGDIKILGNIEYRFPLYRNFRGALFTDIGNVWDIKGKSSDLGTFEWDRFYKEFAVGIGFGLRYDLSILVIRLDGSIPFIDPSQDVGKKFVLKENSDTNIIYNFGIGYPF